MGVLVCDWRAESTTHLAKRNRNGTLLGHDKICDTITVEIADNHRLSVHWEIRPSKDICLSKGTLDCQTHGSNNERCLRDGANAIANKNTGEHLISWTPSLIFY